ncbi:MAG: hypothetical protein KJ600_06670 [Nanoarchaeota archaeon]|nr:hypothetical protein [Nanoarchaeota archaeon]MBU1104207.1 hypothetical protein [Nanoarchaeota archaeon]
MVGVFPGAELRDELRSVYVAVKPNGFQMSPDVFLGRVEYSFCVEKTSGAPRPPEIAGRIFQNLVTAGIAGYVGENVGVDFSKARELVVQDFVRQAIDFFQDGNGDVFHVPGKGLMDRVLQQQAW